MLKDADGKQRPPVQAFEAKSSSTTCTDELIAFKLLSLLVYLSTRDRSSVDSLDDMTLSMGGCGKCTRERSVAQSKVVRNYSGVDQGTMSIIFASILFSRTQNHRCSHTSPPAANIELWLPVQAAPNKAH